MTIREGGENRPLRFWGLLALVLPTTASALGLFARERPDLLLKKGESFVLTTATYQESRAYFTSGSTRTRRLPDGSHERYHDAGLAFSIGYGLHPRITLWLDVPSSYRAETDSYHADAFGLGDVSTAIRFSLMQKPRTQIALDVGAKFPTADTSIGSSDRLPLGDGMTDLRPSLTILHRLGAITIEESVGAVVRSMTRVEYLTTQNFRFTDPDGNPYDFPVGNLRVGFGDRVHAATAVRWDGPRTWSLLLGAGYDYRANTTLEGFEFSNAGGSTDAKIDSIRLGRSQRLSSTLSIRRAWGPWMWRGSWEHVWWGENAPIPALTFVESMIGERFSLGVSRAF